MYNLNENKLCVNNRKVLGFTSYLKYKKPKKKIRKMIYGILYEILFLSPNIKDKKALRNYYKAYDYTPKKLENSFDGELTILIVDNDTRGKGIGQILFDEIIKYAKISGMRNIKIDTDDCCNYQFYERNNCIRKYTTEIVNGEKIGEAY